MSGASGATIGGGILSEVRVSGRPPHVGSYAWGENSQAVLPALNFWIQFGVRVHDPTLTALALLVLYPPP